VVVNHLEWVEVEVEDGEEAVEVETRQSLHRQSGFVKDHTKVNYNFSLEK
jgi:hypothetical protein